MPKADPFAAHVAKAAKSADVSALATALGALVGKRLTRAVTSLRAPPKPMPRYGIPPTPQRRAKVRRLGRGNKRYVVNGKWNSTRPGTWTHHMIATICAHTDTRAATLANLDCGDATYAAKRLDFNWAAEHGYITWEVQNG